MRRRAATVVLVAAAAAFGAVASAGGAGADATGSVPPVFVDTFGSSGTGDGNLEGPRGVAVDPDTGDVYVADTGNDRVVHYDAEGRFVRAFHETFVGGRTLDAPSDVAIRSSGGLLYVADTGNDRIVSYDLDDGVVFAAWGSTGSGNRRFRSPRGLTLSTSDRVYVADTGNDKIKVYDLVGNFVRSFGSTGSGAGQLRGPRDVATNINDRVFVADTGNDRISVWTSTGTYQASFGSTGSGNRRFESPSALWEGGNLPPTDSLFVADTGNDRISVWHYQDGSNTATWEATLGTSGDENGELEAPQGVFFGDDLRRYVTDTGNDRLARFDAPVASGVAGTVTSSLGAQLDGVVVLAQDATTYDAVAAVETDRNGRYQLPLPAGDYLLAFFDPSGGHAFEYHPNQTDFALAQPVTVLANAVLGVDASLAATAVFLPPPTGVIKGRVDEAAGPAARTWALAVNASTGRVVRAVQANPAGRYRIDRLPTANYLVLFIDPRGVNATEFHDDQLDPSGATAVTVTSGGAAVTVDADLDPPA